MRGRRSRRERRRRERRRPHPLQAGGATWEEFKRMTVPRMRRALVFSLVLHVAGALAFVIGSPWKKRPPPLRAEIPIHLVSMSPEIRSTSPESRPPAVSQDEVTEAEPEVEPEKTEPEPRKEVVAVPVPTPEPEDTGEDLAEDGSADTLQTISGSVSVAGGGEGVVEIGVDGPISAYSYYLAVVRDKIARYWNPPAGLVAGGNEIASVVNFRIDRRGKITASYVEEPSGTGVFDQAGLRAVAQADPLPPLPQDYDGDWLGIHLRFVYRD